MTTEHILDWFAQLSAWEWIGLVVGVVLVLFLLRNVPDFLRYMRIRTM
jgi:hypothetical protein